MMAAYKFEGRLMIIASLIAILATVAFLPFSNCGKSTIKVDPAPKYPDCVNSNYSPDLTNLTVYSTYLNLNMFIPNKKGFDKFKVTPKAQVVAKSALYGKHKGPATTVTYLMESHPSYSEDLFGKGIPPYKNTQTLAAEYLYNSKTIYITLDHISGDTRDRSQVRYMKKVFYYKVNCKDAPNEKAYRKLLNDYLFRSSDSLLGATRCWPNGSAISESDYGVGRAKFIKDVIADACKDDDPDGDFDCPRALRAIKEEPGSSYADIMPKDYGERDASLSKYECPYLSVIFGESPDSDSIVMKEYYADEVHPMVHFGVFYYKIDFKTKTFSALVYISKHLSFTTGTEPLYPYDRVIHIGSPVLDMTLTSCSPEPIFEHMYLIDDMYRSRVRDFGTIYLGGGAAGKKEDSFGSNREKYRSLRWSFSEMWEVKCVDEKFFLEEK